MARPRIEMTDTDFERLINMIRIQCTADEVCGIFGMSQDTLDRRIKERGEGCFADLFKKHSDEGKASLRRAQWKAATENLNPTMLVWLGKQMLEQTDKHAHDHVSSDGSMTPTTVVLKGAGDDDSGN